MKIDNDMTIEDVKNLLKKIVIDDFKLGDKLNIESKCDLWRKPNYETGMFDVLNGQISYSITIKKEFKKEIPEGYVLFTG